MISIVKDGESGGVRFLDKETGADLSKTLCIGYGATVTFQNYCETVLRGEILMVNIEKIDCDKAIWSTKHPETGILEPVAAIEFRDGTRVEIAENGTPRSYRITQIGVEDDTVTVIDANGVETRIEGTVTKVIRVQRLDGRVDGSAD